MKFINALKITALGAGIGIAASAWAVTCTQCNYQFDRCLEDGNRPSTCRVQFQNCAAQSEADTGMDCYLF